ncbi:MULTISPECIES: hypothetical protein [Streptosporangium]|uniref:Uncharacterized protein n=1 Tax=Streptosporangium brasiliense TaxID=47480 RepID=A0ABT9R911_9ACTN|nr:hypothetical protein [Streptosporangium brasiliense]MDP9864895.1 hypothetical protein [Streptosporangium brasiliense]
MSTRVFPGVQHPPCIGVFVRYGMGDRKTPTLIHHVSLSGVARRSSPAWRA